MANSWRCSKSIPRLCVMQAGMFGSLNRPVSQAPVVQMVMYTCTPKNTKGVIGSLASSILVRKLSQAIDGQMGWVKWAALDMTRKKPYPNPAQPTTNRVSTDPTRCIGSCLGQDLDP